MNKVKKIIIFVFLLYVGLILIYRLIFSYTITTGGEIYKHKLGSVEFFPSCIINPFYKGVLIKSIEDFLNEDFKEYYQKEYANINDFYKLYFQDMDKALRGGFTIISIRETEKEEVIEILIFKYHRDGYSSTVFIFNKETQKIIGFY